MLPPTDEMVPTDDPGAFVLDDELVPFVLLLGDDDGEDEALAGMLCPLHLSSVRWLLQRDEPPV